VQKFLAVADDPDEWGREIPANLTENMLEKQ
jgi:hypothetical protein